MSHSSPVRTLYFPQVSLGYGVSGKLQSGVSNLDDAHCWACGYCDSQVALYQVAMLSAQISTGIFLLLATFSSMPVSATHSIIGAIVVSYVFCCIPCTTSNDIVVL